MTLRRHHPAALLLLACAGAALPGCTTTTLRTQYLDHLAAGAQPAPERSDGTRISRIDAEFSLTEDAVVVFAPIDLP